jgi:hypothetical protein
MTGEREPQPIGRHYRPPHSHAPVTRGWVVCRRCTASSATRTTRTNLSAVHQPRGPSHSQRTRCGGCGGGELGGGFVCLRHRVMRRH